MAKKSVKAADENEIEPWKSRPTRRDQILTAAAEAFENGSYHTVAIDQIGEAAGITGPAIYRHFRSKSDILLALLFGVTERLYEVATRAIKEPDPHAALSRLIRSQIDFALEERGVLSVYIQERYTLPRSKTRPLRRLQHQYLTCWDEVLATLRPDLKREEVKVLVRSSVEMINSIVFYDHPVKRDRIADLLHASARRAMVPSWPMDNMD